MDNICLDNRFELINKYKQELIEATNIESSPEEMAVLNDILFRFWQMGWLDKLENYPKPLEKLTDSEQRIFLSAMAREKEVCKEFDASHRSAREPYEDSLIHICNEIERKVKDALWT